MDHQRFGNTEDYVCAFERVRAEGIPNKHIGLLQAHFEAPNHTATARQLAERVGYRSYKAVNLQYGTLARRIAEHLHVAMPPEGFWLYVLADWADDEQIDEQPFVLRQPVVDALCRLGFVRNPNET